MAGDPLEAGDLGFLLFVTLPAGLFWIAYRRGSLAFGGVALVFDAVWMAMQVQSWWVPYAFGTSRAWQLGMRRVERRRCCRRLELMLRRTGCIW
jgi:hypothetical protein